MPIARNAAWAEAVQLLPILSFAFPFIVRGDVDIARAAPGFLIGAILAVAVSALVLWKKQLLNPVLVGTALWLWVGAIAFNLHIEPLENALIQTRGLGLFVGALVVGAISTFASPYGYVACRSNDPAWIRRASLGLLALTAVAVVWAWCFRQNIRLGGGLPFIVLNVVRRVLGVRAPGTR